MSDKRIYSVEAMRNWAKTLDSFQSHYADMINQGADALESLKKVEAEHKELLIKLSLKRIMVMRTKHGLVVQENMPVARAYDGDIHPEETPNQITTDNWIHNLEVDLGLSK